MTDCKALRNVIDDKGVKHCKIAEVLGVSRQAFQRKLAGDYQFKLSEIVKIRDFLNLTDDQLRDIFLQ